MWRVPTYIGIPTTIRTRATDGGLGTPHVKADYRSYITIILYECDKDVSKIQSFDLGV